MAFFQPLDFEHWFVNVFAGNITIFFYIMLVGIFWMGAKFRMPSAIIFACIFIFILLMGQAGLITTGLATSVLIPLVIILGLIIFAILARQQK